MRNLFRSFDRFGVEYLLISGQASILYGAATFSEDIDLWVNPTQVNLEHLIRSLAACRARVYKLTPPLTLKHFRRGHGFHFTLPARPDPLEGSESCGMASRRKPENGLGGFSKVRM